MLILFLIYQASKIPSLGGQIICFILNFCILGKKKLLGKSTTRYKAVFGHMNETVALKRASYPRISIGIGCPECHRYLVDTVH